MPVATIRRQPLSRFLTGKASNTTHLLWASIDEQAHHLQGRVCERRFAAYCAPYLTEADARAALIEAGADPSTIAPEPERRGKRGRG